MHTCARCLKNVDFVQRDYLFESKEVCQNCHYILLRLHISKKSIEQLHCNDCGELAFLDEGEFGYASTVDHSTVFRCERCVRKIIRQARIDQGESQILLVSNSEQYAILEEVCNRRDLTFNRFRGDPDSPDSPLQLHFTYEDEEMILSAFDLHNRNLECQDFYETDWMMFLDDETDVIDLYFTVQGWKAATQENFSIELEYNDPFLQEILKLARFKWPFYDGDEGRCSTAKMLIRENIGTVLWNEFDTVFSDEERKKFAEKRVRKSDVEKFIEEMESDDEDEE